MKIKFQADADFNQTIISALQRREPAIEFQTADEAQIRGMPDPEVLAAAARDGRILVSHDHHTMPVHFADFIATQQSPGVFLLSQDSPIQNRRRRTLDDLGSIRSRGVVKHTAISTTVMVLIARSMCQ